jgi:hypothetical protein
LLLLVMCARAVWFDAEGGIPSAESSDENDSEFSVSAVMADDTAHDDGRCTVGAPTGAITSNNSKLSDRRRPPRTGGAEQPSSLPRRIADVVPNAVLVAMVLILCATLTGDQSVKSKSINRIVVLWE